MLGTDASADPVARALLGYLATGAARQAAMVADLIDPPRTWSQAAALGYHLVRTRRDPAAWPPEVLDRTADTPDGAVLAAWHRLERMRTGAESPSAVAARAAFVAAAQRDLPVCTDGLRILVEGMRLTRLAEPDPGVAVPAKAADPALAGALARCARYLAAADTTAPLLSYEGAAPDLPGPARPAPRPQDAVALDLAPAGALADPFDELFTRTFARGLAKAVMTTADLRQAEALVTEVYARGGRRPAASAETGFYRALDKAAWQTGRRWRSGGPTDLRFTPPRDATAAETGAALRTLDAVTRLPRGQRVVTEMAFVQGLAEDEIARELAVPRGVATAYLRRARRTLRKLLGGPVTDAAGPAAAADRHLQGRRPPPGSTGERCSTPCCGSGCARARTGSHAASRTTTGPDGASERWSTTPWKGDAVRRALIAARTLIAVGLLIGIYVLALVLAALDTLVVFEFLVHQTRDEAGSTTNPVAILASVPAVGAVFWGLATVSRPSFTLAESVALSEQDAPRLWRLTDELARTLGTEAPSEIHLTAEVNAAVTEESWLLGLVAGRRRLYLGLPLLLGMTEDELRAVLGHELGHYAALDTRLAAVVHRGSQSLHQLTAKLELLGRASSYTRTFAWVVRKVFAGYTLCFDLVTLAMARQQERAADARAVHALAVLTVRRGGPSARGDRRGRRAGPPHHGGRLPGAERHVPRLGGPGRELGTPRPPPGDRARRRLRRLRRHARRSRLRRPLRPAEDVPAGASPLGTGHPSAAGRAYRGARCGPRADGRAGSAGDRPPGGLGGAGRPAPTGRRCRRAGHPGRAAAAPRLATAGGGDRRGGRRRPSAGGGRRPLGQAGPGHRHRA